MAIIMKAKPVIDSMFNNWQLDDLSQSLLILSNADDPASKIYVRNKAKKCEEKRVRVEVVDISKMDYEDVRDIILSSDCGKKMIQLPLPSQLQSHREALFSLIGEREDIDALKYADFYSWLDFKIPCTPLGISIMLDYYIGKNGVSGKDVVVIGRSNIVGRPIAALLENRYNCTVTICHSKTKDLKFYTQHADIVICAVGIPYFLTKGMIKENSIVIDVGINRLPDGKVVGDADYSNLLDKVYAITPVPGGVGPMTVASLVWKMGSVK